jgi:undecaprenyl diphosphate synthase
MRVVGELVAFDGELRRLIADCERRTVQNSRLNLTICANYGGRWDIAQAAANALAAMPADAGSRELDEKDLTRHLAMSFAPDPDLLIRTGGERRISNFLLWQLAYTELWFTDTLWPDFDAEALDQALRWYAGRERRFGMTSEQLMPDDKLSDAA